MHQNFEDRNYVVNDVFLHSNKNSDFELVYKNRDPFLDKVIRKVKVKTSKTPSKKGKKKIKKDNTWPFIKYLGLIKKQNGEEIALLKVRKSFVKMKKEARYEEHDFYIKNIYKDSIVLVRGSEKKIIKKVNN